MFAFDIFQTKDFMVFGLVEILCWTWLLDRLIGTQHESPLVVCGYVLRLRHPSMCA